MSTIKKIALGTAQFGMDYGINNKRGKTPREEAIKILNKAIQAGIDTIDTASAYGDSEKILGDFLKTSGSRFRIISKLPICEHQEVKGIVNSSLRNVGASGLYGYLVHNFENYKKDGKIWDELEALKKEGKIEKIGFSLYSPKDLDIIYGRKADFDILQIPYSIFDRRFEGCFAKLIESGVEIHVRSIFLQGLVFLDPKNLPPGLSRSGPYLDKLRYVAAGYGFSIAALCLGFVLRNKYIDKVVIGVDSLEHLKNNICDAGQAGKIAEVNNRFKELEIEDEGIILPFKWKNEVTK